MTETREFVRDCERLRDLMREGKVLNPHRLWKLEPRFHTPDRVAKFWHASKRERAAQKLHKLKTP